MARILIDTDKKTVLAEVCGTLVPVGSFDRRDMVEAERILRQRLEFMLVEALGLDAGKEVD